MDPISFDTIKTLAENIKGELPHRSAQVYDIYQQALDAKISQTQAICAAQHVFKKEDFYYHPQARKAFYQFCRSANDSLIQCDRNEEIIAFHRGEPLSLNYEKALEYLQIAFDDKAQDLLQYCENWLIFYLGCDLNEIKSKPPTIHIDYYRAIYEDASKCQGKITEEMVVTILRKAMDCGCVTSQRGFTKISQPSLEDAALAWLSHNCDGSISILQRYLKWAYENKCQNLMILSLDIYYSYYRDSIQIQEMYRFARDSSYSFPLLQLVCMIQASKYEPTDYPSLFPHESNLRQGAEILHQAGEKAQFRVTGDMILEVFTSQKNIRELVEIFDSLNSFDGFGYPKFRLIYDGDADLEDFRDLIRPCRSLYDEIVVTFKGGRTLSKFLKINPPLSLTQLTLQKPLERNYSSMQSLMAISKLNHLKKLTLNLAALSLTNFFCELMKSCQWWCLSVKIPAEEESLASMLHFLKEHQFIRFAELGSVSGAGKIPVHETALIALNDLLKQNRVIERIRLKKLHLLERQKVSVLQALEQNPHLKSIEGLRDENDSHDLQARMNRYHYRVT